MKTQIADAFSSFGVHSNLGSRQPEVSKKEAQDAPEAGGSQQATSNIGFSRKGYFAFGWLRLDSSRLSS